MLVNIDVMSKNWYAKTKHLPGVIEKHRERQRLWRAKHPDKWREYYATDRNNNREKFLWKRAKARAVKRQLEFTLEIEDIVIPEKCPIFNRTFDGRRFAPSIDRIDPKKGYVKENIRIISRLANSMKWDATPEELQMFCQACLEDWRNPSC